MSRRRTALTVAVLLSLFVCTAARAQRPALDRHGDALPPGARARLGTVRFRHGAPVTFLAFAPDGKTLLASNGGPFVLWETASGRRLRLLPGMTSGATSAAFSPDGKTLTLIGRGGALQVWDPATGKELRQFSAPAKDLALVTLSSDGKTAALLNSNQVLRLWDLTTDKELRRLTTPVNPQNGQQNFSGRLLAISPDGKLVAAAGTRNGKVIIRLWEVDSGRERPALIKLPVILTCLTFSPDGQTLAVAENDRVVTLVNLKTGDKFYRAAEMRGSAQGIAFAPDGKALALVSREGIDLMDRATGKLVRRFRSDTPGYFSLAFSGDGKILAAGGTNHAIHLWDVATGKESRPTEGTHGPITATVYSPDGKTLATTGADQAVRLWDAATGKELQRLSRPVKAATEQLPSGPPLLAFLRGGRALASAWPDSAVVAWETATGKQLPGGIPALAGSRPLAFAPDGHTLAIVGPDGTVRVRDVLSGRELRRFGGPSPGGQAGAAQVLAAFAPDGRTLALATGGGFRNPYLSSTIPAQGWIDTSTAAVQVRLWELTSGRERGRMALGTGQPMHMIEFARVQGGDVWMGGNLTNHLTLLALSPDGRTLVAALGGAPRLYDLDTGRELRRLDDAPVVGGFAFAPDGRLLAIGERSGFSLWNVATGEMLCRVGGHEGVVNAVTFSPDGKALVSGATDTTALVWDVPRLLAQARRLRTGPSPQRLEALWADLAGADAARAYRAVWALAAAPAYSVPFLGARLKAVPPVDGAKLTRLVASLDDPRYATRQRAVRALEALGEIAEPSLRKVLDGEPSLELRRRVDGLLEKLEAPLTAPEALRALRAVEALERAGTAEARGVLEQLARGAVGARLTRDARAAVERLDRRRGVAP